MSQEGLPNHMLHMAELRQLSESSLDYRERLQLIQADALKRRQVELGEQCSALKPATERIRIWERLHQLPLPRGVGHPLITVIAADTELSFEEVQAEQCARAEAKKSITINNA